MRLRKLLVPAIVVALSMPACGGDDPSDATPAGGDEAPSESEDADVAGAPESSANPGDSEESADEAETGANQEEVDATELFTAIADATVAAGSYEFEATTGAGGTGTTAAGAIRTGSSLDESNMRITAQADDLERTVLLVDGQIFIEITEDMELPADGSWMTAGPDSDPIAQQRLVIDVSSPKLAGAIDDIRSVSDQLAELTANADMVTLTRVGTAEIDGIATTEYHVDDIAGFTDSVDETIAELSYSMWVGDDDLIRRVVTDTGMVTTEIDYLNYGTNVDVEAPADEVLD